MSKYLAFVPDPDVKERFMSIPAGHGRTQAINEALRLGAAMSAGNKKQRDLLADALWIAVQIWAPDSTYEHRMNRVRAYIQEAKRQYKEGKNQFRDAILDIK